MLAMNIEFLATMGANEYILPPGLDTVFRVIDALNVFRSDFVQVVFHITTTMRAVLPRKCQFFHYSSSLHSSSV